MDMKTALVFLFWLAAAVLVAACHVELDPLSPSGSAVAIIAVIVGASWAYTRLCAPCAGVSHALGVGIAWLVLTIVTEMGCGRYALLGAPNHPLLRNLFLFGWIFAPALFARREVAATSPPRTPALRRRPRRA
jgi:hypothetical protein